MGSSEEQVRGLTYRRSGDRPRRGKRLLFAAGLLTAAFLTFIVWYVGFYETPIRFFGRVVDENGSGVPGVRIAYKVRRAHGGSFQFPVPALWVPDKSGSVADGTATTDAKGTFVVKDRGTAFGIETLACEGYYPPQRLPSYNFVKGRDGTPPFVPDPNSPITFTLKSLPLFTFYGKVLDEQGKPIDGAKVTPISSGPSGSPDMIGPSVVTDSEGMFLVRAPGLYFHLANIEKVGFTPYGQSPGYYVKSDRSPNLAGASRENPAIFTLARPFEK